LQIAIEFSLALCQLEEKMKPIKKYLFILCLGLFFSGSANAALVAALGGQVVNDTDLNITWLANANLTATNTFGLATGVNLGSVNAIADSIINSNGTMTWGGALTWINAMNAANYLGYNDWRLPITPRSDTSCTYGLFGDTTGYNCTGSEMGHLYYTELGGLAHQSIATTHNTNYGLFQNLSVPGPAWSSTEYPPCTGCAWGFDFSGGDQYGSGVNNSYYHAMAVRTGQVAAVPLPAAAWLFGSALIFGFVGFLRKHKALP
jgi:hypothetical protein